MARASETPSRAWSALVWAVCSAQPALVRVASVRPLAVVAGHAVDGSEEERMVHDEQVGAPGRGLVRHRLRRVDRQQHLPDRRVRVAGDQADGVPGVGRRGRVPRVEQPHHVPQRHRHDPQASALVENVAPAS